MLKILRECFIDITLDIRCFIDITLKIGILLIPLMKNDILLISYSRRKYFIDICLYSIGYFIDIL